MLYRGRLNEGRRAGGGKVWADDGINIVPLGSTCMWSWGTLKGTVHRHVFREASKSAWVNTRGGSFKISLKPIRSVRQI